MAKKKTSFNIKDKELAEALSITLERLYEICDFFDADDEDEWDLTEEEHFIWLNKTKGIRLFSPPGAYGICKYIDTHEGKNIFRKLKRWLNGKDRLIRSMLVKKKIIEVVDDDQAVVYSNQKAFLSPRATRSILGVGTRQDVINRVFQEEMKSTNRSPLELDKHFIVEGESDRYFSDLGINRISANLGQTLTNRHRRQWCELVAQEISGEMKQLTAAKETFEDRVSKAMARAKKRAKKKCEITGEKQSPANPFDLAAHHVFDKAHYPHLADHEENILVIKDSIHREFHAWMGGTRHSCDLEDFEKFIVEFSSNIFSETKASSQQSNALRRLKRVKKLVKPLA